MTSIPNSKNGMKASEVATEAALLAGQILISRFSHEKQISFKGRGNLVTDVDVEVETKLRTYLLSEYPDMGFVGEETAGTTLMEGYVWVVDPIDGTRNFASGIPFYSVVVALVLDGQTLVGVTYDPTRKEMFVAVRNEGALVNGKPMMVSKKNRLADSVLGTDISYSHEGAVTGLSLVSSIWPNMQTVRIMGSAALGIAYVAAGRTDLYFHHQLEVWDQVAGLLLVREAGGMVSDRNGDKAELNSKGVVASNPNLNREFMSRAEGTDWMYVT